MEALNSLPFQLNCSRCAHLLIEAFLAVETPPTPMITFVVERVDMLCPNCQAVLKEAIDDISRQQEESWHSDPH